MERADATLNHDEDSAIDGGSTSFGDFSEDASGAEAVAGGDPYADPYLSEGDSDECDRHPKVNHSSLPRVLFSSKRPVWSP